MDNKIEHQGEKIYHIIRIDGELYLVFPDGIEPGMALDIQEVLGKIEKAFEISEND